MDTHEEKEAPLLTMRHLRALAGKRGYRVRLDDTHLSIIKKSDEQIACSFDVYAPFRFDPLCTQQFHFMQASLWMRGYHLTYEESTTLRIERAKHHRRWSPRPLCAKQMTYQGFFLLLTDIALWIHAQETHHCAFQEVFPREEEAPISHAEHGRT